MIKVLTYENELQRAGNDPVKLRDRMKVILSKWQQIEPSYRCKCTQRRIKECRSIIVKSKSQ